MAGTSAVTAGRLAMDELSRKVKQLGGTLKATWFMTVKTDVAKRGRDLGEAREVAQNMVKRRSLVNGICSTANKTLLYKRTKVCIYTTHHHLHNELLFSIVVSNPQNTSKAAG